MSLDLQKLRSPISKVLEEAGWTIDTLATASESDLTLLPGIGAYTAGHVIRQARKALNTRGLELSAKSVEKFVPTPTVIEEVKKAEEPPMSERVRRIKESMTS